MLNDDDNPENVSNLFYNFFINVSKNFKKDSNLDLNLYDDNVVSLFLT